MWTSNGKMICDFGGQVLCTRAPSLDGSSEAQVNQHHNQTSSGNP